MAALAHLQMPDTYIRLLLQMSPDPARLLAGSGLTLADLGADDGTIAVWQQLICTANSAGMLQQPEWHLAWLRRVADRFHGPITGAWLSAPTAGEGLDVFVRYLPTRIPYLGWQARTDGEHWRVTVRPLMDLGDITALSLEVPLLTLGFYLQTMSGGTSLPGVRYEFPHSPLTTIVGYNRIVAGSFRFGAPRAALVMPLRYRALRNPGYDEVLWRAATRRCEATAQEHAEAVIVPTVMQALYDGLEKPWGGRIPPTLEEMATRLHLSTSTLNRRLRDASTSYQALIDDVRRQRARELLANPRWRVGDVAAELGFAEPTSFVRSFKRWYGETPGRYRRKRSECRR